MYLCDEKRSKPEMGTLAWGQRSGPNSLGRLTRVEKLKVLANLGVMGGLELIDTAATKLKIMNVYGADLAGLIPPNTGLVADSLALAEETLGEEVFQHSWRTYYWGMILGGYRGLEINREILFSAAILHDLGLAKDRPSQPKNCCFVVHGAERAKDHLVSKGHDPAKARNIGDAIGLHLNGYVAARTHGVEAHLVNRGAMCDVFGFGTKRIAKHTKRDVFAAHPKGDLKNGLEIWPGHHLDGTRADFLIRRNKRDNRQQALSGLVQSSE